VVINSTRQTGGRDERTNVMLAYLKSYERMGKADFACVAGCECEPERDVDALHGLHQSTIFLVRLLVTQVGALGLWGLLWGGGGCWGGLGGSRMGQPADSGGLVGPLCVSESLISAAAPVMHCTSL